MPTPSLRVPRWLAPLAGLILVVAPATAQPGGGGMFGQTISSRDLAEFRDILGMGEEQSQLVNMLYEGYQEQNRALNEEMREAWREARDGGRSAWEGMRERMESMRDRRDSIEETFLADVRTTLNEEQIELWPKVERAHHRSQHLSRGFVRGERVDLIRVVNDLELEEETRAELSSILEAYEIELDRQLMRRVKQYEEGWSQFGELRRAGDMEGIQKLMEEGREASLRVRDVNERFARQISGMLSETQRETFASQVNMATFPDVYRPRHAHLAVDAAIAFDDLTPDQKSRIEALSASFSRKDRTLNSQLVETIEEQEEEGTMEDFFRRGRGDDPADELWREKRVLSRDTVDQLKEILTEDQADRLPEAPRDDDRRRRFRGQRDDQIS